MANTEKPKFDKVAYDKKYHKDNFTHVTVILHKEHDIDVIQHLENNKPKSDYIKRLIRKDMDQ